ncbi:MAG: molecular chaperone DnaJ [Hyphomicrobium sp.]|uniref:molecular chaperone DnaJ n=1 Tax=Hyphomicrobium sp. TaxID=82 RepID=UPI003564AC17
MRIRTPLPSNFEALLTDFFNDADEAGEIPQPLHRFSIGSLEAAWDVAAQARALPRREEYHRDARQMAYRDESEIPLAALLDPHRILSELGLHSDATEGEISMLRREFALRNHPDRVPADLRDIATQRMMIANDLMDRHLAKLRRSNG